MGSVKEEVKNIIKRAENFDGEVDWVSCPCCGGEWTKLRRCSFFVDTGGEKKEFKTSFLCIHCAEGIKAFPFVSSSYSLPFQWNVVNQIARFEVRIWQPFYAIPVLERHKTHFYVVITFDEMVFYVRSGEVSPYLSVDHNGVTTKHDNVYQAWLFIREKILKGDDLEAKVSWGK